MASRIVQLILVFTLASQAWCCGFSSVRGQAYAAVNWSNLKQIAAASQFYAANHEDEFPEAVDVWDYARLLADQARFDQPELWQSKVDPAYSENQATEVISILLPGNPGEERRLNPSFRQIKPVFAVALGKIKSTDPATTPIAWTRGLQPDGTWAKYSPYRSNGGHIAFLSGEVRFFNNLNDDGGQLGRYDGTGRTANILDALPPGTRIGEYEPTTEEKIDWSQQRRITDPIPWYRQPLTWVLVAIWTPSLLIACIRKLRRHPVIVSKRLVYWPLSVSFILLMLLAIGLC